jgi:hypothetical protein
VLAAAALAALAACGGDRPPTEVIAAGQVDVRHVQLPPGWDSVSDGVDETDPGDAGTAGSASASGQATADTIPLEKEDPSSAFFTATGKFMQCLTDNGVEFIGAPDQSNPSSPTNDPNYLKALGTCAAQSNIVQAMNDAQAAQAEQTPEEIQKSNEGFLVWRDCMIGKGWEIPEPTPDSEGRLFSMTGGGGGGMQITPPPGKDLLTSSDTRDCASESAETTGAGG